MTFPTLTEVKAYLATALKLAGSFDDTAIERAMAAEKSAQASICKVPSTDDEEWPAPLVAAFYRRVARHLHMQGITIGITMIGDEQAFRISGMDAETRRLEAPYKRIGSFGA